MIGRINSRCGLSRSLVALFLLIVSSPINLAGSTESSNDDVVKELIVKLGSRDETAQKASDELVKMGAIAVPPLATALKDPDDVRRANVAWTLLKMNDVAEAAEPALNEGLRDSSRDVRVWAAVTLAWRGSRSASLVPVLIEGLNSKWPPQQRYSAQALTAFKEAGKAALPALYAVLGDVSYDIPLGIDELDDLMEDTIEAIDAIGGDRMAAVGPLRASLTASDVRTRGKAIKRLGLLKAKSALPDLMAALKDSDSQIRYLALKAISTLGVSSEISISAIIEATRDREPFVRDAAATALGTASTNPKDIVPILIGLIGDEEEEVRNAAVDALSTFGPNAKDAVPAIVKLIEKEPHDWSSARNPNVEALISIGLGATTAIPDLTRLAGNGRNYGSASYAASALAGLAAVFQDVRATQMIGPLKNAAIAIKEGERTLSKQEDFLKPQMKEDAAKVRRAVDFLEVIEQQKLSSRLVQFVRARPAVVAIVLAYILLGSLIALALWRYPLIVLEANDWLARFGDIRLPDWLGGLEISLRYLLIVGFFRFHPRVLDAWVKAHLPTAVANLRKHETVLERENYVPLPVSINGSTLATFTARHLHHVTRQDRWCILILGEGGLGKTTLACQLALWATAPAREARLCQEHFMLPLLIESNVGYDFRANLAVFETELRGRLQLLIGSPSPVTEELFEQLLRRRRIVVIVDGLSEVVSAPAQSDSATPHNPNFAANAMIVTSRTAEPLSPNATIVPHRIDNAHLIPFINAFTTQAGMVSLSDAELFEACRRLAELLSDGRQITPLLAKLYAEELVVASLEHRALDEMPRTVPDLMLAYLNNLNRQRKENDPDNPMVHQLAKIAAWESIKRNLRPGPAPKKATIAVMTAEGLNERSLEYLEHRLRLIRTLPPSETHFQFLVDPLSEYLGALRIMEQMRNQESGWRAFLADVEIMPGSPGSIKGFLRALRDCVEAKGSEHSVPGFVNEDLRKRTA